jgi:peptidoglycan/LPS O-acetylase OafA/YrhL
VLEYLGRISFSVYLVHGVVFMVLWFTLPLLASDLSIHALSSTQHSVLWLAFIAGTLSMSHFSYQFIERRFRYGIKKTELDTHTKKAY